MRSDLFVPGDVKEFRHRVNADDLARFPGGTVHEVYSTFALTRDAEWACRLFVLEIKEEHEEGIGTFVHVEHLSPAFPDQEVVFKATLAEVKGNNVICDFEALVGDRVIARGQTGQKVIQKTRLAALFDAMRN